MTNLNPINQVTRSVLLIEPDTLVCSERAAQLERANFCVTKADNPQQIYLMRDVFYFSVAVLNDKIGSLALKASAQMVRGQWPKARILVLGKVPVLFEDHLYDETVLQTSEESTLLEMIEKLTDEPWNPRVNTSTAWLDHASLSSRIPSSRLVQESDPTKVLGNVTEPHYGKGLPGNEQLRKGGSLR